MKPHRVGSLAGPVYENRIYCWGCWWLRRDSVSHASVWSAAVPLFPFAGRLGIAQGKAGRQTQGGEAAKNLTYYREVRLLLFAVTFWLSGLAARFLFTERLSGKPDFFHHANMNSIFFPLSLSLLSLSLSLSLARSLVLRHPVLCFVAQRQRVWRHKGMHHKRLCCLLCVRVLKGIGDLS